MPPTPSSVKAMLPTASGTFCSRMKKLIEFPRVLFDLVSYFFTETGTFTTEFKAAICQLPCAIGGGSDDGGGTTPPPNANMAAPTNVIASDGSFSDKVRISWNAVTPPTGIAAVTTYKIYRALSSVTNPNLSTLIANVAAPTLIYDDTTAVQGVIYRFWIVATNGTDTSSFSSPDLGNSSVPLETLDAVTDLIASIGHSFGYIALVWTPPTGATKYDIYRGTTNVFDDATLIYADRTPYATTHLAHNTHDPDFWDNVGEVVLYDIPMSGGVTPSPIPDQDFYYWVVAKSDSPPAISPESNDALGRIQPPAIYNGTSVRLDFSDDTYVVDTGLTKMWAVLTAGGGGGAGGGGVWGGGGGGGPGIVREAFTVVAGDTITIVTSGSTPDTGNATSESDASDGTVVELKINGVTVLTAQGGKGGHYDPAGGGLGGDGDSASGTTSPTVFEGVAGLPGVGSSGGRSGYAKFDRRHPEAYPLGGGAYDGNGLVGSGARAVPADPTLALGGAGTPGFAYLAFGT